MAQQIKDTNVIKTPEVVINPQFFLPPDVIDMRSGYTDTFEEEDVSVDEVFDADAPVDDDVAGDDTSLEAPENFSVVEQIVRIGPDGNAVVDVIIEFVDDGHNEYDIRVTKDA
jgi:hypothetical protein